MKIKKFFILSIFFFLSLSAAFADDRKKQLDKLFNELKTDNSVLTFEVEQKIWKIWSTHPKKK